MTEMTHYAGNAGAPDAGGFDAGGEPGGFDGYREADGYQDEGFDGQGLELDDAGAGQPGSFYGDDTEWTAEDFAPLLERFPEIGNPQVLEPIANDARLIAQAVGDPQLAHDPAVLAALFVLSNGGQLRRDQPPRPAAPRSGPQRMPAMTPEQEIARSIVEAHGPMTPGRKFWCG
jgi:hypothetical protein